MRKLLPVFLVALLISACITPDQSRSLPFTSPLPPLAAIEPSFPHTESYLPLIVAGSDQESAEMVRLLVGPGQQRSVFVGNDILARCACLKAQDMAERNYIGHTDPDGWGPNHRVRECGYNLTSAYPDGASNQIESLAAGYANVSSAWAALMASTRHRVHLLGEEAFFAEQNEYGVCYHYNPAAPYRWYYVYFTGLQGDSVVSSSAIPELYSIVWQ